MISCISTALLFLDIFFAKRAESERFEEQQVRRPVPVGFLWSGRSLLAVFLIFIGSWYPAGLQERFAEWNASIVT